MTYFAVNKFFNVVCRGELVSRHVEGVEVWEVPQVAKIGDMVVTQVDVRQLLQHRKSLDMFNPKILTESQVTSGLRNKADTQTFIMAVKEINIAAKSFLAVVHPS